MPVYIVAKSITNVDWCWMLIDMLFVRLIDADCWLIMADADWRWLIVLDADWCWLMLIDADWCWLTLIVSDFCWLMLMDATECWLMLMNADWCWLRLIDAQIRFNKVFFCRSVPPELLRSFYSVIVLILNENKLYIWHIYSQKCALLSTNS